MRPEAWGSVAGGCSVCREGVRRRSTWSWTFVKSGASRPDLAFRPAGNQSGIRLAAFACWLGKQLRLA